MLCHHIVDEKSNEVYYKKGEESACIYCHTHEGEKSVSSIQKASHKLCVSCHNSLKFDKKESGPVNCRGCHDETEQKKINILTQIPRLKRNQPDNVLITGYDNNIKLSENLIKSSMEPVAFNHKAHEISVASCKICHHKALTDCKSCHTVFGDKKGDFISLESAMHNMTSQNSCFSCHNLEKKKSECAGCHSSIPEENFPKKSCVKCHAFDKSLVSVDSFIDKKSMEKLAYKTIKLRSETYEDVFEKIPEKVIIDTLSDEYEPVNFPHFKIFNKIKSNIEKNTLARSFHKTDKTLCVGCHHYSPPSLTPVKCQSCHSKTGKSNNDRPDLKTAYHRQCISCHDKMKIKTPAGTDCVSCHLKQKKSR
jgi:hypothetical protein